jgi:hypothetical protein
MVLGAFLLNLIAKNTSKLYQTDLFEGVVKSYTNRSWSEYIGNKTSYCCTLYRLVEQWRRLHTGFSKFIEKIVNVERGTPVIY